MGSPRLVLAGTHELGRPLRPRTSPRSRYMRRLFLQKRLKPFSTTLSRLAICGAGMPCRSALASTRSTSSSGGASGMQTLSGRSVTWVYISTSRKAFPTYSSSGTTAGAMAGTDCCLGIRSGTSRSDSGEPGAGRAMMKGAPPPGVAGRL